MTKMSALRCVVGVLLLFAAWANHTSLFGVGGNSLLSLLLAVVGLSVLASVLKTIPESKNDSAGEPDPESDEQPRGGDD